jgi:hypothetical protein
MLLLAAVLVGAGFWFILRSRFLLDLLLRRYRALRSPRAASLTAITILAIGIGLAGFGCRLLMFAATSR